jgi:flagellar assembly protein FliH
MMTLSKIVSRENAGNAQRWRIPDMSSAMPEQESTFTPRFSSPSDLEILTTHEQAQSEGFEAGHEKGFKQGKEEGRQAATEELQQLKELLLSSLDSLQRPLEESKEEVEQELLELSLGIAKQILRREIKTDPRHIIGIVREAVKQLPSSHREITLHLQPDDAHTLRETLHEHKTKHHWNIIDDPGILQGNCQIQSESSFIDASIDALIARIAVEMIGGQRHNDSPGEDRNSSSESDNPPR